MNPTEGPPVDDVVAVVSVKTAGDRPFENRFREIDILTILRVFAVGILPIHA